MSTTNNVTQFAEAIEAPRPVAPAISENAYTLASNCTTMRPQWQKIIDGRGFREAVKGSNLQYSGISASESRPVVIIGAKEDCIDVVRGSDYIFKNLVLVSKKDSPSRSFVTAKGGINGLVLSNIVLVGSHRWWGDIRLGDFHDYYADDPTPDSAILLDNVKHASGRKVRVLVLNSEKPTMLGDNFRCIKVPSWIVRPLFAILKLRQRWFGNKK